MTLSSERIKTSLRAQSLVDLFFHFKDLCGVPFLFPSVMFRNIEASPDSNATESNCGHGITHKTELYNLFKYLQKQKETFSLTDPVS